MALGHSPNVDNPYEDIWYPLTSRVGVYISTFFIYFFNILGAVRSTTRLAVVVFHWHLLRRELTSGGQEINRQINPAKHLIPLTSHWWYYILDSSSILEWKKIQKIILHTKYVLEPKFGRINMIKVINILAVFILRHSGHFLDFTREELWNSKTERKNVIRTYKALYSRDDVDSFYVKKKAVWRRLIGA